MILKNSASFLLIVLINLIFAVCITQAGEVKLTTYYPAPYGEYDVINIPETTSASKGVIKQNGVAFIHTYGSSVRDNIFIGANSGNMSTSGYDNTAIGASTLQSNTSGSGNTAIGFCALKLNTTSHFNVAVGNATLVENTTGSENVAMGDCALRKNTTGYRNIAIGNDAVYTNSTGNNNVGIGSGALYSNTSSLNVAVGTNALYRNTTGMSNTAVGTASLNSNTTGSGNTAVGDDALELNTSGASNVAIGLDALYSNTAGSLNTVIGYNAGRTNSTGNGNVFLGHQAGYSETGSNKLYIANSSANPPLIYGDFSTARVGIGTTSPQAKLEVNSTNSGFLPPRMSTAQRDSISSPPAGLMIYNTSTNELQFYNSTAWLPLATGGFGTVETKNYDTVYYAATDGFVLATCGRVAVGVGTGLVILKGQVSSSATGSFTTRAITQAVARSGEVQDYPDTCTMPVKKGEWWKVTREISAPADSEQILWIPAHS